MRTPARSWRVRAWILGAFALVLIVVAGLAAGELLSRPARSRVGPPPAGLGAVDVAFATPTGLRVAGWFIATRPSRGAILLLHGVHADRRQMLDRVPFLRALGYSILLVDLPAHGESEGDRITFGAREAAGVEAAVAELRRRAPGEPIGVIGASMGAAAAVLAHLPQPPDAMVLESMYPTIEEATDNRLRNALGPLGPLLSPLLLVQLPLRAGVTVGELHPIEAVRSASCPVFVLNGSEDRNTTPAEALRIYGELRSERQSWVVPGAGHVDLHAYAREEYEARVGSFLTSHLERP